MPSFRFVLIKNIVVYLRCFLGLWACLVPLGDFRSVAALVLFGSLGTVGGRAGYSVIKVQLKEAFTYSEVRRG